MDKAAGAKEHPAALSSDSGGARVEQSLAMNEEQQQIAIAEACPKVFAIHETAEIGTAYLRKYLCYVDDEDLIEVDPLNDLNAMHEAEKMLLELSDDVSPWELFESYLGPVPVHATAAQRAEAFLRTIGKWDDQ